MSDVVPVHDEGVIGVEGVLIASDGGVIDHPRRPTHRQNTKPAPPRRAARAT
jgi:hypothetical protein